MEILISDRQDEALDKDLIKEICVFVLQKEQSDDDVEVSISLVEPDEMRQLNVRYRNIDKATDVLSFSLNEEPPISILLGDIVLCPQEVRAKAKIREQSFDDYFGLLVVHATLHLMGYGHKADTDAKVMSDRENQLLEEFDVSNRSFE